MLNDISQDSDFCGLPMSNSFDEAFLARMNPPALAGGGSVPRPCGFPAPTSVMIVANGLARICMDLMFLWLYVHILGTVQSHIRGYGL